MTITEKTTIAEIAAALPSSVRVFQRHGIDFCCGGKKPIADACRDRGLTFAAIVNEIEETAASRRGSDRDWSGDTLAALIGHIVAAYHEPLREELPRLEAMAAKVSRAHGSKDPRLVRLCGLVAELAADLHAHMQKEERVLFPSIDAVEAGRRPVMRIDRPIGVMEDEHDRAGALLADLRETTDGYEPPEWGCATLRALYHGLAELEADMHVHVHLENNLLFPRALRLLDAGVEA
jgi:regulator of cell morphogenesis and NO signaling